MAATTKRTPVLIARIRDLHAGGASAREIAEQTGVSRMSVLRWLRDIGCDPGTTQVGDRVTRPRPRREPEVVRAAEQAAEVIASRDVVDLPADREVAHAVVARRLAAVRGLLDRLTGELETGGYSASSYGQLTRIEMDLASRLAELAPPVPVDPEADVGNVEAAASVGRRLARLVEAAEASAACPHCHARLYAAAS